MTVTLTSNYRDTLAPETLALIDPLVDDSYELSDMLVFIDEHGEEAFQGNYETYVELGEDYGYDAVDALLTLVTPDCLEDFTRSYIGCFAYPDEMAQDYFDDDINNIHHCFAIDWRETAENLLEHYVDRVGEHYFRTDY